MFEPSGRHVGAKGVGGVIWKTFRGLFGEFEFHSGGLFGIILGGPASDLTQSFLPLGPRAPVGLKMQILANETVGIR